jgi:hypothetical protein
MSSLKIYDRDSLFTCPPTSQTMKLTPFDFPLEPLILSQLNPIVGTYCIKKIKIGTVSKIRFTNCHLDSFNTTFISRQERLYYCFEMQKDMAEADEDRQKKP